MKLVIGKGHLAKSLKEKWPDLQLVGRPEFDLSDQTGCDKLFDQYPNPSLLINTIGCISENVWQNFVVNFVAPAYLTTKYIQVPNCHIINISSSSAWWPSFPGLDFKNFSYKIAKESLSQFGRHINRIIVNDQNGVVVSTIEPGRFISPMSGYTGRDIEDIVSCVALVMEKRFHHLSLLNVPVQSNPKS